MWIYEHVDGEIAECFPEVVTAMEDLIAAWPMRSRGDGPSLRRALERLVYEVTMAVPGLRPFDEASQQAKHRAHFAFDATLRLLQELTALIEDHCPSSAALPDVPDAPSDDPALAALVTAYFVVHDFMEEWRPYISYADIALALVCLDDVPFDTALAAARDIGRPFPGEHLISEDSAA